MTTTVIVGAGAAGLTCAKHLRDRDPERTIIVLDKDPDVPYERPPLSKGLTGSGTASVGTEQLIDACIDVVATSAVGVNLDAQIIETTTGPVRYDDLVLAPGSRPHLPTWITDDVHVLHTLSDNRRLRAAVQGATSAVVVGGGFLGAELAASLASAKVPTTFVFRESALFRNRLGADVSELLTRLHTDAGITLIPGAAVEAVHPGRPAQVTLTNGLHLEADLVIAGVGSHPDTDWLAGSALLGTDGTITANDTLQTAAEHVWAAGDSVSWIGPDGYLVRSAHWTTARSQGKQIADDLADGTRTAFTEAPYFWSLQHGNLLQGVGHIDPAIAQIDVAPAPGPRPGLIARYLIDGRLAGAAAINHPQGFIAARAELESTISTQIP